jgi:hypothetical protein
MRNLAFILSVSALCSTACTSVTVSARPAHAYAATQGQLNAALDPYGDWVVVHTYGRVWRPRGMAADWRPYTLGIWTSVDGDWVWQSELPWGWAAFHYGRWTLDPSYGWVWVPDDTWGPAWVVWRSDTDWVGWAPLPPQATWHAGVFVGAVNPDAWCFVERRHFGVHAAHRVMVRPAERRRLVGVTRVHAAPPPRGARAHRRHDARADARPAPAPERARPAPAPAWRPGPKASPAPRVAPASRSAPAPKATPAPAKKGKKAKKDHPEERGKAKGRPAR